MRWCIPFTYLLTLSLSSLGQDYSYTQYNVKDGLAGAVVYCAAEDKDGFLWFGTESGLSRFDGTHFRNFTTANGLPDNEIIKLFVDSRNRVWIAPFRNSICYYLKGELHNQDNDPILHQLSIASAINVMAEDKDGNIILVEPFAIHILSPDQKVKNITQTSDNDTLNFQGGGLDRDSLFAFFSIGRDHSIVQNVIDGGKLKVKGKISFVSRGVNNCLLSPDLNIFQYKDSFQLIRASGKNFSVAMPRSLNSLSRVDDSLFTLNTTNGAYLYNLRTRRSFAYLLKGQSINAVFRDSEGNLWFMCYGGGVFRIGSLGFRNVIFQDGKDLSVTDIQNIGDELYIGTERSSLWRADMALHQVTMQKVSWHTNKVGRILAIAPVQKNSLLLGTDGCLILLNYFKKDIVMAYFSVKSITSCKEGFVISSSHNVEVRRYTDLKKGQIIWPERSTCSCQQDSLFYFGTLNGLYSIIPGQKARFWGDAYPVFKSRIATIAASPDGVLWIGTSGSGMAGIKAGRLLYSLSEKDGLTSNICRSIFVSGDDIWVGTDKGLNRVHMEAGKFRINTFRNADGLSSDIINTVYVHKDDVYVGSANGLTYFNVHEATQNSYCKLRITSIQAARHTWNYDTTGLVLPPRESSIRVDFVAVSYRSGGDITYQYRLKGLNNNWQTTRETFLSYPTLPAGGYDLEIVATNKFGIQSVPVHIVFTVEKLLWEKTWFIIFGAVILAGIIWSLVWLRIRQLKRKNAEKISISNRMADLEQKSLKAQMNPHFIFNSLNSIQKYVMEKDIKGANKFITDFSRLIRLTLEITSKSRISIDEEVSYISNYLELEKARFGNTFQYDIAIDPGINRGGCYIPPMLLQPYVENSIRHGLRYREDNKGMILIRFMEIASHLICTIEDNGVGRKLAQQYKSLSPIEYQSRGMSLTARRMEMMNQGRTVPIVIDVEDMETDDHHPAGTKVIIRFPIQFVKTLTPML
jgi:ligand-binding sensor domain-containing protein